MSTELIVIFPRNSKEIIPVGRINYKIELIGIYTSLV